MRGPQTALDGQAPISFIGSRHTFGRFVERPFAIQVANGLDIPGLNLGVTGASLEFYLKHEVLSAFLARSETIVMEVWPTLLLSAGMFEVQPSNGMLKFVKGPRAGVTQTASEAYNIVLKEYGEAALNRQIALTQAQWLRLHKRFARQFSGRKILLWLSNSLIKNQTKTDQPPLGNYPHFVTTDMMTRASKMGFEIVEHVLNTKVEKPGSVANVFATPEQHDNIARDLIQHIQTVNTSAKRSTGRFGRWFSW